MSLGPKCESEVLLFSLVKITIALRALSVLKEGQDLDLFCLPRFKKYGVAEMRLGFTSPWNPSICKFERGFFWETNSGVCSCELSPLLAFSFTIYSAKGRVVLLCFEFRDTLLKGHKKPGYASWLWELVCIGGHCLTGEVSSVDLWDFNAKLTPFRLRLCLHSAD